MLFNILSLYLWVMIIIMVYWASHIRFLSGAGYTRKTVLLCFAVCIYMFGYCLEINSSNISQIIFWNKLEYFGIPFVSALWFTVALTFTGNYTRYKKLLAAFIYLIPIVTLVLRLTNEYHHLYFAAVHFVPAYGRVLLVKQPGPGMYVQMIHSMLMVLITSGLYLYYFVKNKEKETGKIKLMIAASFFAVLGLILIMIKPFGLLIDYMLLCLPVSGLIFIMAILRYDFLETKTMARSKIFEATKDAILLVNHQNKIIDCNKSAKYLFEKIKIDISEGYIPTLFGNHLDLMKGLCSTEASIVRLTVDHETFFYEIDTQGIGYHSVPHGYIKTIRNVTEMYNMQETLKWQAMTDDLSGLSNRRAFKHIGSEWLKESDEQGKAIHLLMFDLDHFKDVNDKYGHPMGDEVIRFFGKVLREIFYESSLLARLGGEEFAILLAGFSDKEIEEKANSVLNTIALHEYDHQNQKFHVTVSIGVAKKGPSIQTLSDLMHNADKALYQSKSLGRNRITICE